MLPVQLPLCTEILLQMGQSWVGGQVPVCASCVTQTRPKDGISPSEIVHFRSSCIIGKAAEYTSLLMKSFINLCELCVVKT